MVGTTYMTNSHLLSLSEPELTLTDRLVPTYVRNAVSVVGTILPLKL